MSICPSCPYDRYNLINIFIKLFYSIVYKYVNKGILLNSQFVLRGSSSCAAANMDKSQVKTVCKMTTAVDGSEKGVDFYFGKR